VQARLDRASGYRRLRRRPTDIADEPRSDPTLSPGVDRVPGIAHIVLLMMENHSFDNYLGRLGRGDGLPEPAALNRTLDGTAVKSHHFASTKQTVGAPSQ
jgi:phospholipase C